MSVDPNEIIVTVGATEAMNLCLQAVAKPGDTIAVESPTFYAMLHAIERMGMKAIEVATHPEYGIDIAALAAIAKSQQANLMRAMVSRFFPEGTRISSPAGGYVMWVELPAQVDAMRLYQLALEQGITIGPGYMFSIADTYRNFIRLN